MWNAPATLSSMTRVLAGGEAIRAAILLWSPAATSWPAPLWFAISRPSAPTASITSVGSPPRIAAMLVGCSAAALAIARARIATSLMASSSEITPAIAAAANSPTE